MILTEENITGSRLVERAIDMYKLISVLSKNERNINSFVEDLSLFEKERVKNLLLKRKGCQIELTKEAIAANLVVSSIENITKKDEDIMRYCTISHEKSDQIAFVKEFIDAWNATRIDYSFPKSLEVSAF